MRMLRLAKLAAIWERMEAEMGSLVLKQSVALFRVICVLIGICHWNACIWWIVGKEVSLLNDLFTDADNEAWMKIRHWTTVPRPDGELWTEQDTFSQYIFCFYWTLGVMRTMPSEVWPVNNIERVYVMVFMFFAFSAFAICVALITQTFFKFSERKKMFDDDMSAVRMIMRKYRCSENVQQSVKSYCRHLFENRKIIAKELNLMQQLPKTIQLKIKYERLREHFHKFAVLSSLPPSGVLMLCEIVDVRDLHPGVCICRAGMVTESAWLCMTGRLKMVTQHMGRNHDEGSDDDSETHRADIEADHRRPPGSVYAEHVVNESCLITEGNYMSPYTVTTITSAELLKIDKSKFMALVTDASNYNDVAVVMRMMTKVDKSGERPWSSERPIHQVAYDDYDLEDEDDDRNSSKDSSGRERSSTRRKSFGAHAMESSATTAAIIA
jgi:hypothetical protein